MTATSLYETDFYGWTQQQSRLLHAGDIAGLDFDNILEEIEAMGRAEKRSLRSRLAVLLLHLLQWQYQPQRRGTSWRLTIIGQRTAIHHLLEDSPGLKHLLDERLKGAWDDALKAAEAETGMARGQFPPRCPWDFAAIMDDGFWPEAPLPGEDNRANG